MTITPEKLREIADNVVSASYELNTAAFDGAYEALRQAADEIERLRRFDPDHMNDQPVARTGLTDEEMRRLAP